MKAIFCSSASYLYQGIIFERGQSIGVCQIFKNGNPYKTWTRKFDKIFVQFEKLTPAQQETYRLGGGCIKL